MNNLRITQILWTLGRGGAERMVFDLSCYLKEMGHSVTVMALAGGGPMKAEFEEAGIPVQIFEAASVWKRMTLAQTIEQTLTKSKPDIVHTHLGGDVWGGIAARKCSIPWLITAHGAVWEVSLRQRLGRGWAYKHADHIAAVSKKVGDDIKRRYHISNDHLSIIPAGLDLDRFTPRDAALPGDIPTIISVGRLVPEKGHATLLRALAHVKIPWKLELIGDGPERMALLSLAETLGILPRVHFVGAISDVGPRLKKADLFCFPSWHEGQGLALYEAAAVQVPVIASDLDAFRERFDESMIRYVDKDDIEGWAKAITDSLNQYGESLERAKQAYAEVKDHYTRAAMGDAYAALYAGMLKERGKTK